MSNLHSKDTDIIEALLNDLPREAADWTSVLQARAYLADNVVPPSTPHKFGCAISSYHRGVSRVRCDCGAANGTPAPLPLPPAAPPMRVITEGGRPPKSEGEHHG